MTESPTTQELATTSQNDEEGKTAIKRIESMIKTALHDKKIAINSNQLETELNEIFEKHSKKKQPQEIPHRLPRRTRATR